MHLSNSIGQDSYSPAHLVLFQPDATQSGSNGQDPCLQKYSELRITPPEDTSCIGGPAGSSGMYFSHNESTAGNLVGDLRQISSSSVHNERDLTCGHQAKRARVETIIKGMTNCSDMVIDQHEETSFMQQIGNIQNSSLHQKPLESEDRKTPETRKYLERQHKHLRQLRTKFPHIDTLTDTACRSKVDNHHTHSHSSQSDVLIDPQDDGKGDSRRRWNKKKLENYFHSKPERVKLMADTLKFELSQAVSRSVDSIFKCTPFFQMHPNHVGSTGTSSQLKQELLPAAASLERIADVQTEALSLVLPKPDGERLNNRRFNNDHHQKSPPFSFSPDAVLHEEQSERFDLKKGRYLGKLQSKVHSRSVRSSQTPRVLDAMLLENLEFPHVKIKSDSLVTNNLYMLSEGLTTNHLKKAKLMFFYTRYPSSLVLKLCFDDVQFTRCITSQLIKWFSNFREFYYIQMEKFARQAVREDVRTLTVGRESELFRVLNVHYNKANDFQVPDRFLEVAEITLREFYVSISMGKDRDPSWKKAIYKVICKLDSDVPSQFKSHHCGEEPGTIC